MNLRGATSVLVPAVLGGLLLCGTAGAVHFPVGSTGDIWFQADHAGFRGDDGNSLEEYYFRVPNSQLEFEERKSDGAVVYEGRAHAKLTFFDADGRKLGQASETFEFSAENEVAALSADRVQLFVLREDLHPRTTEVEVVLEDMNARKRGLIYLVTKKQRNGSARASLIPPPFQGSEFGLSDVQFAWSVEPASEGARFLKNGFNVVPNPGRIYGLYRDTLQVYYEVYDDLHSGGGTYFTNLAIRDDTGEEILARADTVAAPGGLFVHAPRVAVRDLPAGTYDLEVGIREFGSNRTVSTSRAFSVIWSEGFWGLTEEEILDEARVLLTERDYDRFKEMQSGDREAYLAAFWTSHDPSPNTARNELREVFQGRVDFANRNYSTSFERGMVSDRGRIFIRYGQPDEVTREVLPQMGSSLSDILNGSDGSDADLGRITSSNSNALDTRPYEIWSFTRLGEPLFPERESTMSTTGLTFIFVDEQGIGNYVLRYSSAFKRF